MIKCATSLDHSAHPQYAKRRFKKDTKSHFSFVGKGRRDGESFLRQRPDKTSGDPALLNRAFFALFIPDKSQRFKPFYFN